MFLLNSYRTTHAIHDSTRIAAAALLPTCAICVGQLLKLCVSTFSVAIFLLIAHSNSFSQSVTTKISLPAGSRPEYICVDELSNRVYVTDGLGARVFEIDGVLKNVLRIFNVPPGPSSCTVNPITKNLYVYSMVEQTKQYFNVIDLNSGTVESLYTDHLGFYGIFTNMALHPTLDKVYFLVVRDLFVYNGKTRILSN